MRYPILIEPGTDTGAFGVIVPDLPGCFSAGDTLDEALDNAQEAIAAWIDEAMECGLPVPLPSTVHRPTVATLLAGWIVTTVDVQDPRSDI